MLKFCFLVFIAATVLWQSGISQNNSHLIESLDSRNESTANLEGRIDLLASIEKNKINLNNTDEVSLANLDVLNTVQISSILRHIERSGKLIDLLELQAIPNLDRQTIAELLPYVKIGYSISGSSSFLDMILKGDYQVYSRIQRSLKLALAYSDTSINRYSGSPLKIINKYSYRYKNIFRYGFQIEKDAGEASLIDFYSAYFSVSNYGPVKKFIIGDFDVNFGQGLISWTGFGFGKGGDPISIRKISQAFMIYNSSDENIYYRGVSLQMRLKFLDFALFLSRNKIDANLIEQDTSSVPLTFSSLLNSGLHRNTKELNDRNNVNQFSTGGRVGFQRVYWHICYNLLLSKLNAKRVQNDVLSGDNWNGEAKLWQSLDYHWNFRNLHFFGELAYSGTFAFLNGVIISVDKNYSISILHRNYDSKYKAYYSSAFSESSSITNESGIYFGQVINLTNKWIFKLAFDYYKHPYIKYRSYSPSEGFDISAKLLFKPSKYSELVFTYKFDQAEENNSDDRKSDYLINKQKHKLRFSSSHKFNKFLEARTKIEYSYFKKDVSSKGIYLSQDFIYKPFSFPLSLNFRFAVFDSESNNSKIYSYENDVLYAYSVPAFIGQGFRFYALFRVKIGKNIDTWFRYSFTAFPSSELITSSSQNASASNPDAIMSNNNSEIKLQTRLSF